eukprot:TRINITY_DN21137_c0_g1_i1.p1 TRINITY_DN21137_c0_g1~~TRINITY_DN21137_c0_g1_i1.p1  ORF type:complete len:436 (-),score=93.59 TRINITY_DN21137_c0_g1_i1:7-1263(-)
MEGESKRILILSCYFFPYHDWIDPKHTKILFLPRNLQTFIDSATKRQYNHIEYFDEYATNGNVEIEAIKLNQKFNFTHVVYQAEQDIIRAARIRKALGLPGQTVSSALCFRDKCIMKDHLKAHLPPESKVLLPTFEKVTSPHTIIQFVKDHGLPVVVKPTRGMGSVNTHIIKTEEDLQKMLSSGVSPVLDGPIDYEVEKFIEGQMYHIDGFVHENVVRLIWPSVYMNTCVGYLSSSFLGSHSLSASNPLTKRLMDGVVQVLKAMEAPPSYSFHVELWHTPTDELVFCEAASRTGGAGVAAVTLELFEVNLNKACIQGQIADPITSPLPEGSYLNQKAPSGNYGWIVVYPRLGEILSMPSSCPYPYVVDFEPTQRKHFPSIAHCTDALGSFIVSGNNEEQIRGNIQKTVQWFTEAVKWK